MDQLLNSLPKTALAIIVLVLGLLFMRFVSPPKTICDAQLSLFHESQKRFLYTETVSSGEGIKKASQINRLTDLCKTENSPGACFELFEGLKKTAVDLDTIPEQCAEAAAKEPGIKQWLLSSVDLMVKIAWGEKPPASYLVRKGWFDTSEISLFCELRRESIRIYGQENFRQHQENLMTTMPKAEHMLRDDIWKLSLLSMPCQMYR